MREAGAVRIPLTKGHVAFVSAADAAEARAHRWHYNGDGSPYAVRWVRQNGKSHKVYLHRQLTNSPKGDTVTFGEGGTLDCTRSNMKVSPRRTGASIMRRKMGPIPYAGVSLLSGMSEPEEGKRSYRARIKIGDKRVSLGQFFTPEDAARAYDTAAVKCLGATAHTNFPLRNYVHLLPEKPACLK